MIKCPNCGGELKFNPGDQVVHCDYCDSNFSPDELNRAAKSAKEIKTIDATSYRCRECGAELLAFDDTAITFCSYCGSQAMLEGKMVKVNNPDYVIPFSLTKDDCIKAYKARINKSLFTPNYMKEDVVVEKFRGIYMPYCIYKVSFHGDAANKGSKYNKRVGDYVYYDDYEIKGRVDASYDGISYDLMSKLYDKYTESIPYNFKEAKEFNLNYLIGYYADSMDVKNNIYDGKAIAMTRDDSAERLSKNKIFSKYGCTRPILNSQVESRKIGMFPLYFLSIRNKDNKHIYYAVVNGQTGKVAMDLPIDSKKYILFSLIVAIPLFLIFNNVLLLLPKRIVIFSIIFSIIIIIFSSKQLNDISANDNHFNDIGYVSQNMTSEEQKELKKTKGKSKKIIFKPIIGIILGILILIVNPVSDIYYYVACFVNFLLIVLSFVDLIKEHNLLSTNKLPQLEKRGGDEK